MNVEAIRFIGTNGVMLPGVIWSPDGPPCMILQITHGMTEHIGRYAELAEEMAAYGIAVAGFDLRGHGLNGGDQVCASFGKNGWSYSLHDMHLFYLELESRFPDTPHFMLGFSLGSFLLRDFLGFYKDKVDGAIIMGTGDQPGVLLYVLMQMIKKEIKLHGFDSSTPRVRKMSFENYNQKFAPNKTPFDWLCADEEQLALYGADSHCRKEISAGLFYQLLDAMKRTGNPHTYKKWNRDMPVFLLSGTDDPVGDFGKGVQRVKVNMKRAGITDVQMYLLPDARHDLIHEVSNGCSVEAIEIMVEWLFEKL